MKDKTKEIVDTKIAGLIDQGTELQGDLNFKGSFRIEGNFKGNISSESLLIIGERGKVEADVKVGQVIINGEIRGTVQATERIEIHNKGRVFGTLITPNLIVEEGAFLNANCQTSEIPMKERLENVNKAD
ncbi:MAG: polymer-forming cytoskeletal protein [Acidobacteriota bacterium]|nr:polymer-forming cytoskeletal protein [Acidobacteriota bacterium]